MKRYFLMLLRQLSILLLAGVVLLLLLKQFYGVEDTYIDLNRLTSAKGNTNFSRTKILLIYPENPATIWDQHNKLYKIYGDPPDSINVINNTRLIKFTKPTSLHSDTDSIAIDQDDAKYAGYMGITTHGRKFLVDAQGNVREVGVGYPEPKF